MRGWKWLTGACVGTPPVLRAFIGHFSLLQTLLLRAVFFIPQHSCREFEAGNLESDGLLGVIYKDGAHVPCSSTKTPHFVTTGS